MMMLAIELPDEIYSSIAGKAGDLGITVAQYIERMHNASEEQGKTMNELLRLMTHQSNTILWYRNIILDNGLRDKIEATERG